MDDPYDIFHDLEGDITCQDLYKLHTGHYLSYYPGDSVTSSDSSISKYDDHLKPPPYTYEEITQNLVVIEGSEDSEFDLEYNNTKPHSPSSRSDKSPINTPKFNQTPQEIQSEECAKKLSYLITRKFCFICHKPGGKHYKQDNHYKRIFKWLEEQLKEISQPVDIELLFCQICNLVLTGNDEAKKHYEEKSHKEKAKSFCLPCLRVIEEVDMPAHCQSKRHLKNIDTALESNENNPVNFGVETTFQSTVSIDDNLQDNGKLEIPKSIITGDGEGQQNTILNFYASVSTGAIPKKNTPSSREMPEVEESESAWSEKVETASGARKNDIRMAVDEFVRSSNIDRDVENEAIINPFAIMLIKLLQRSYCHVCRESVRKGRGYHYRKKQHYKALQEWIEQNGRGFGYNMNNVSCAICFPCHSIFPTLESAQAHYTSEAHEKFSKYYCDSCMVHDNSDFHQNHKKGVNFIEELKDKTISIIENIDVDDLISQIDSHIVDTNILNYNGSESGRDTIESTVPRDAWRIKEKRKSGRKIRKLSVDKNEVGPTKEHVTDDDQFKILESTKTKLISAEHASVEETRFKMMESIKETSPQHINVNDNTKKNSVAMLPSTKKRPAPTVPTEVKDIINKEQALKLENPNKEYNSRKYPKENDTININKIITLGNNENKEAVTECVEVNDKNLNAIVGSTEEDHNFILNTPDLHVAKEVMETYESVDASDKRENIGTPQMSTDSESSIVETPIPILVVRKEYDDENIKRTGLTENNASDSHITLSTLGLKLNEYTSPKIVTDSKKHSELCKNLFLEFGLLAAKLESLPLEVCSTYIEKFSKEIDDICKKYATRLDESEIKCKDISNPDDQSIEHENQAESTNIVKDRTVHTSLKFEITRLDKTLERILDQRFSYPFLTSVRRVIMIVRNFEEALELMKPEESSLDIESVLKHTDKNYPPEMSWLGIENDALYYEIYKVSLIQEVDELKKIITCKTSEINICSDVILESFSQFNRKLLELIDKVDHEEERLYKYFFADKLETKNESCIEKRDSENLENICGFVKSEPEEIGSDFLCDNVDDFFEYSDSVLETNNDSRLFESANECSCEDSTHKNSKNKSPPNEKPHSDKSLFEAIHICMSGCVLS